MGLIIAEMAAQALLAVGVIISLAGFLAMVAAARRMFGRPGG